MRFFSALHSVSLKNLVVRIIVFEDLYFDTPHSLLVFLGDFLREVLLDDVEGLVEAMYLLVKQMPEVRLALLGSLSAAHFDE
jgi:hypothetical protein